MFSSPKLFVGALGACLLSATGAALAAAHAEIFEADAVVPSLPISTVPSAASPQPAVPAEAQPAAPAAEPTPSPAPEPKADPVRRVAAPSAAADPELTCLARVILYEAGAESRSGQLAVAQVVMNRVRSPRFPNTICGVVNQRGQFAAIRGFHPPRDARWRRALAVAREAQAGGRAPGIGNALFFHAARVPPFRGRTRVARLGNHVFYR